MPDYYELHLTGFVGIRLLLSTSLPFACYTYIQYMQAHAVSHTLPIIVIILVYLLLYSTKNFVGTKINFLIKPDTTLNTNNTHTKCI